MNNIRCKVCDYSEDHGTASLFHNSTTDGYEKRRWIIEPDGPVCEHCTNPSDDLPQDDETEFALLDDWPDDWGNEPLPRKGWY